MQIRVVTRPKQVRAEGAGGTKVNWSESTLKGGDTAARGAAVEDSLGEFGVRGNGWYFGALSVSSGDSPVQPDAALAERLEV